MVDFAQYNCHVFLKKDLAIENPLHHRSPRLHRSKYSRCLEIAQKLSVHAVINGGDMFSKGGDSFIDQKDFISHFFDHHLTEYDQSGIDYLCLPGNDDLAIFDELFDSVIVQYPWAKSIAQKMVALDNCEIIEINRVADYSFRLKDRCRMDTFNFVFPEQYGTGLLSRESGEY